MDNHHPHTLTCLPQQWHTLLDSYFANSADACCLLLNEETYSTGAGLASAAGNWDAERIGWVNPAMTTLLGKSAAQLHGLPVTAIFADDPLAYQEMRRKLSQKGVARRDFQIHDSDGSLIWIDCECHNICDDDGQPLGHICSLKKSPRQEYANGNRSVLAESLQEAQHIAQIGSWELCFHSNQLHWSDEIYHILEVDKESVEASQETFRDFVHPDDAASLERAFWQAVENQELFQYAHRLCMPDGRIKYIHELAKTVYDDDGKPLRTIGTVQDITVLQENEEKAQFHRNLLHSIFNAVYSTDTELRITSWNRAAEEMYGWQASEVIGKRFIDIMRPTYVGNTIAEVRNQIFTEGFWQGQAVHKDNEGNDRDVLVSGQLLRNNFGQVIGTVGISQDISDQVATQKALQESEGRLKRAESLARIGHYSFDKDLADVFISDGLKEIWGYAKSDDPHIDEVISLIHPDDQYLRATMAAATEAEQGFDLEWRVLRKDGEVRHIHAIAEFVPGHGSQEPRFFGTMVDITARKEAAALLETSQQQLRSQYQNLPVPTFTYQWQEGEFLLIDFNEAADAVTNGMIKQLKGKTVHEVVPGRADLIDNIQACFESRSTFTVKSSYTYPSTGVEHHFRYTYAFAPPDLVMVFSENITEETRAKEAQRLIEERLEQAVRVADIGIFEHDHVSGKLYWSPELRRMYGVSADREITLDMAVNPIYEEDLPQAHANVAEAWDPAGDGLYDNEHRIVLPSGEVRWITIRSQTFFSREGAQRRPVRTVGAKIDITAHKQTAEELRIKEAAFESAINGIAITDAHGELLYVNPSFLRMWGYPDVASVIDLSIDDLWHYGDLAKTARESLLQAGSWIGDIVGLRSDGSRFDAQLSSSTVYDQAGKPLYQMCAILDRTRQKRDERFLATLNRAALAMQRAHEPMGVFTAVADELSSIGLDCGIFTIGEDDKHLDIQHLSHNQDAVAKALKMTSVDITSFRIPIDSVDAFKLPIRKQQTIILDNIVETTRQFLPRPLRGLAPRIVKLLNVPKSINTPMIIAGEVVGLFTVQSQDLTADDIPTITAFGNQMAAAWQQSKLFQQAKSELSARVQAENEVRRLNVELEQRVIERTIQLEFANKELEAFSYSVSHDLRAPLRAIDGYTRFLLEDYRPLLDEEGQRICDIIRSETQRMGFLIDELLSFSRLSRTALQTSTVNMAELARTVMLELCASEDVSRINYIQSALAPARGDEALLRQVWQNLLSNALKFSANEALARIEVTSKSTGAETIYSIRDNGAGFDMEYADKLFGVFQRLHSEREFEGTGVGLAIVQRIIQRHGGHVWAEGVVDKGATFYFSLPRKEKRA